MLFILSGCKCADYYTKQTLKYCYCSGCLKISDIHSYTKLNQVFWLKGCAAGLVDCLWLLVLLPYTSILLPNLPDSYQLLIRTGIKIFNLIIR